MVLAGQALSAALLLLAAGCDAAQLPLADGELPLQLVYPEGAIPPPEGTENYNDEALGEAEEVSAFTYYPVDSSVLNNIVGSVQEVITDLLGVNNEDELVVRNAIEEKVATEFPMLDFEVGLKGDQDVEGLQVNLNITEAEEEVIGGKEADLSEKPELLELQPELETDLVGGDVEKKLSVWEDDSLWDDLGEEREVVWDLGKARDEDGGGEGGGRVYFPVPQLPSLEAPMLDDLPLLSWVEQQGAESKEVESNALPEEEVLFVEEDLSLLLGAGFQNADQDMASEEDGVEQVTKPKAGENMNIKKINRDKIEDSPMDRKILDSNVIDDDEIRSNEVKISGKVTMKVVIVDKDLIPERKNGESSKKEAADKDLEMSEKSAVVGQRPEEVEEAKKEEEGWVGKGESKAEPRSIGNARTLPASKKVVETLDGLVQGVEGRTDEGKVFHKYLGVPYAAPPLGDLRFQRPRRNRGWEGFPAGWSGAECLQVSGDTVRGQEDCLVLSLWVPEPANTSLPVLVLFSPPKIDSTIFVNKNLILVTVNSRKGALGYLRLSGLPGNLGLWDQLQAIHWLRENLSRFGGDPSRLTIGGVGQAAEETHAHLLSQHATGLVSKAILDSGSLLGSINMTRTSELMANSSAQVVQNLGCGEHTGAHSTLLACIQAVPAELVALRSLGTSWGPVVDDVFLVQDPLTSLVTGAFTKTPVLSGEREGVVRGKLERLLQELGNPGWGEVGAEHVLGVKGVPLDDELTLASTLARWYTGSGGVVAASRSSLLQMVKESTVLPNAIAGELIRERGASVFRYWLPLEGGRRPRRENSQKERLLSSLSRAGRASQDEDEIETEVLQAWATFATGGEDSWPQFNPSNSSVMVLGSDELISSTSPESQLLWKSLVWQPLIQAIQEKKRKASESECKTRHWRPVLTWSWPHHHLQPQPQPQPHHHLQPYF